MVAERSARSVDLDAGKGRGVAAAAGLEGFELMEVPSIALRTGLEKHAVKVGLVPLDVFDGAGGEDAV